MRLENCYIFYFAINNVQWILNEHHNSKYIYIIDYSIYMEMRKKKKFVSENDTKFFECDFN